MFRLPRLVSVPSIAAVAAVLAVAPATAAPPSGTFKGTTSQNHAVSFQLRGKTVRAFSAGINMICVQDGLEVNAVIPPKAMKLKGRSFSYRGRDATDGTNIRISGTVSGSTVKGTIRMTDSRYDAASQSFDSCVGSARFTARRR